VKTLPVKETRSEPDLAERVLRLDIEGEAAVTQFAETWVHAMATQEEGR
jgi:hypothetical protein